LITSLNNVKILYKRYLGLLCTVEISESLAKGNLL